MQLISADSWGMVPTAMDKFINSLGDSKLSGWKPLLVFFGHFFTMSYSLYRPVFGHAETGNTIPY